MPNVSKIWWLCTGNKVQDQTGKKMDVTWHLSQDSPKLGERSKQRTRRRYSSEPWLSIFPVLSPFQQDLQLRPHHFSVWANLRSHYLLWPAYGVSMCLFFPNILDLQDQDKMTLLLLEPFAAGSEIIGSKGLPVADFRSVNRVGGGIMAGHRNAWNVWNRLYHETLELMLRNKQFIGKDQTIMNNAVAKYPHSFSLVSPQPYFEGKGDPWFYLQYYFTWPIGSIQISPTLLNLFHRCFAC